MLKNPLPGSLILNGRRMSEQKEIIRNLCLQHGFENARFSRAEVLTSERNALKAWLDKGHQATMTWMANSFEKRTDPSLIMQNVKSVISLSYLYDTPFEHSGSKNVPKISRYAWGTRDYHKIIKKKLKALCREIEEIHENFRTRPYIDDGPVMDKAWAVRSGLGWMGKNTNVIDKNRGSFFFIATILTNIEMEPDKPVEDLCKECNLCVSSCPTGAIYENYKLDSSLCISYQTIENRSEEINGIELNGWIFGCDVCQDVCPFNRPGTFSRDESFLPNPITFNKTFDELLSIDEEQFAGIFQGTPVMRAKYSGWRRNLRKCMTS